MIKFYTDELTDTWADKRTDTSPFLTDSLNNKEILINMEMFLPLVPCFAMNTNGRTKALKLFNLSGEYLPIALIHQAQETWIDSSK